MSTETTTEIQLTEVLESRGGLARAARIDVRSLPSAGVEDLWIVDHGTVIPGVRRYSIAVARPLRRGRPWVSVEALVAAEGTALADWPAYKTVGPGLFGGEIHLNLGTQEVRKLCRQVVGDVVDGSARLDWPTSVWQTYISALLHRMFPEERPS